MSTTAKSFFLKGFFPLDEETEQAFVQRVELLISQTKESPLLKETAKLLQPLDIDPKSFEVTYDKKGLYPWEGGALFYEGDKGRIQLSPKKLFRYSQEEIAAHEMVHAARLGIDQRIFEEILAYQTSKNAFRRFLGPLFTHSKESLIFVLLCVAASSAPILNLFFDIADIWLLCLTSLPVVFFMGLGIRLLKNRLYFSKCKKALLPLIQDKTKTLNVLVRLKDEEILKIATLASKEILPFIEKKTTTDLRWKLIQECYF